MRTSLHHGCFQALSILAAATLLSFTAMAADPGTPFPDASALSDQRAGSVLIYNLYSSSAANPIAENTRINITNTSETAMIAVHLFFIDGSTCSPADNFICLTANQTMTLNASEFDPGTMGYIVAVAVDPGTGCPVKHNFLIGDAYIKMAEGFQANLGAEAVTAVDLSGLGCDAGSSTATLTFNGAQYGRLPMVLAVDSVPSIQDGNATLLVINNPSGDFSTAANPVGIVFGILYSQLEVPFSFTFDRSDRCQVKERLTDRFPRTAPRFTNIVPAGTTGWMKFWSVSNQPLTGAMINLNRNAATVATAYNQGHNLHKLTLFPSAAITIPVFPANCR